MLTDIERSVAEALKSGMDSLPHLTAERGKEVIDRAEAFMPKIFDHIAPAHLGPMYDLVASLPFLPPADGAVASSKDVSEWMLDMMSEGRTFAPPKEYRICAQALVREVFRFSRDDLTKLDVGFYHALMAFVVPMKRAIMARNTTH